jgi:hypothetical protein
MAVTRKKSPQQSCSRCAKTNQEPGYNVKKSIDFARSSPQRAGESEYMRLITNSQMERVACNFFTGQLHFGDYEAEGMVKWGLLQTGIEGLTCCHCWGAD